MIYREQGTWTVHYRCIYRDHWYEDSDWPDPSNAVLRAQQIQREDPRRAVAVTGPDSQVVWANDRLA